MTSFKRNIPGQGYYINSINCTEKVFCLATIVNSICMYMFILHLQHAFLAKESIGSLNALEAGCIHLHVLVTVRPVVRWWVFF